ncbi:HAD family phosphatase [Nocardia sp. BMG51109]|uniref:HAD family hydrolase n=1 Tax=Nocardia sp. BMG51109 TaxID=1056816 RepID=UPI0004631FBB|nr:HAD family phosphatase [Nocardia sp. BMG51109]
MNGNRPAAVVFDCDGTLMDSQPCVQRAIDDIYARRGRRCTPHFHSRTVGHAFAPVAAMITAELDAESATIEAELLAGMIRHAPSAVAMPGAVNVLRQITTDIPVAIASNAPRSFLDATLAAGGLAGLVPLTVAADEVAHPKPAPDLYLAACTALDVTPKHALAVEDSPTGIESARTAGLTVCGIGPLARHHHTDHWASDLTSWQTPWT